MTDIKRSSPLDFAITAIRIKRKIRALSRHLRQVRVVAKALHSQSHPIVAHIVPIRRCNLSCTYCNEFDDFSQPVPIAVMLNRVDRLIGLGTTVITISGGEPMLHPELDRIILHIRSRGSMATLITNGYLLTPQRIKLLNRAGLDHLQISIDNAVPDEVSKKSLKVLDQKLQWLAKYAEFEVNINSVIGTCVQHPEDAARVAKRAGELGLVTTVGIIHDGSGQLRPLSEQQQQVYEEIVSVVTRSFSTFAYYNQFQKNLVRGLPNAWHCHAGSRYLYICENGLVHYCSQQRGFPGIPLDQYGPEHLEHEYHTVKPCAPYCTVSCVHQVSMIDQFREQPLEALTRFFPPKSDQGMPCDLPITIRGLIWMFLPSTPGTSSRRRLLTQTFTRAALWCLRVK
jgi:MoaA/NifB/PqqE/SkfB family radical SAM enzyme